MIKNKSFLAFLMIFVSFGCGSRDTFVTIQLGKNLEKIPIISMKEFFQLWIKNQSKLKFKTNVTVLLKDSEYVYFGKNDISGYSWKSRFFKLSVDLLKRNFQITNHFLPKTWNDITGTIWYQKKTAISGLMRRTKLGRNANPNISILFRIKKWLYKYIGK